MTGLPLILVFVLAIVLMIVAISKWKLHPFIAIMSISLLLGLVAGIPITDRMVDGKKVSGIANIIGAGFSGTFSSIGIVIILGALIGSILEATGAALKLADIVIKLVGKKRPVLAMELMGWVVSIPVFCDSGFVILNPIRKALVNRTGASSDIVNYIKEHATVLSAMGIFFPFLLAAILKSAQGSSTVALTTTATSGLSRTSVLCRLTVDTRLRLWELLFSACLRCLKRLPERFSEKTMLNVRAFLSLTAEWAV